MKKITLLLSVMLLTSLSFFAQTVNPIGTIVFPPQVKTNPNAGPDINYYDGTIEYSFSDQAHVDKLFGMAIRMRPITATEVKDPAVANIDIAFLADFKAYVTTNGLTGTYPIHNLMPKDQAMASTATRQGSGASYGWDTRLQISMTGLAGSDFWNSSFVYLDVKDSNGTLSIENFNKKALSSSYFNNLNQTIVIGDKIEGDYSIYNMSGKVVLNGTISSEINVSSLASGLYVLSTKSGVLKFAK